MDYICCDIDGTLADISHRRHFVSSRPRNWKAFNLLMHLDTPNLPVVNAVRTLASQYKIVLVSGRSEEYRKVTESWLADRCGFLNHDFSGEIVFIGPTVAYERLYMRPAKDYRQDYIVKGEILDQILKEGYSPVLAIDDRQQCVDLWRSRGICTFQCAKGDF